MTFFAESEGKVTAMVRGGRRSQKRFGGALEPFHGLEITVEDRGREMTTLVEARVVRPRLGITGDLTKLDAAAHALRWVRDLSPRGAPEPIVWSALARTLDALDEAPGPGGSEGLVVRFGLGLLAETGYGLDFERCARCGKPCPAGRPAFFDAARGGIVCMACGGARRTLAAGVRETAAQLAAGGEASLEPEAARVLVEAIDEAVAVHAGIDPQGGPSSPG